MALRGPPARRKSTTSAALLTLGFSLLLRRGHMAGQAVSQEAGSRRTNVVFTVAAAAAASHAATVAPSARPEGGWAWGVTFDLPVSSQTPLSRSSFSCPRVKHQSFVSPPDPPTPSPCRSPTPSLSTSPPPPCPPTRTLGCICVHPTWQPQLHWNERRTMQREGFARRFIVRRTHGGQSELRRDAAAAWLWAREGSEEPAASR